MKSCFICDLDYTLLDPRIRIQKVFEDFCYKRKFPYGWMLPTNIRFSADFAESSYPDPNMKNEFSEYWEANYRNEKYLKLDVVFPKMLDLVRGVLGNHSNSSLKFLTARDEFIRKPTEDKLYSIEDKFKNVELIMSQSHLIGSNDHATFKEAVIGINSKIYEQIFVFDDDPVIIQKLTNFSNNVFPILVNNLASTDIPFVGYESFCIEYNLILKE